MNYSCIRLQVCISFSNLDLQSSFDFFPASNQKIFESSSNAFESFTQTYRNPSLYPPLLLRSRDINIYTRECTALFHGYALLFSATSAISLRKGKKSEIHRLFGQDFRFVTARDGAELDSGL